MKKKHLSIITALIGAVAIIIAAIIAGVFTQGGNQQPINIENNNYQTNIAANEKGSDEALVLGIPSGSKVTIIVVKENGKEKLEYEARITREIKRDSSLKIIQQTKPWKLVNEQGSNIISKFKGDKDVDYVVVYDGVIENVRVINAKTQETVFSKTMKLTE